MSGLVVKRAGNLKAYNLIYESVFNKNWIDKELAKLRPYSEAFTAWLASGCMDESRLLRGKALQDALAWAANKNLSDRDNQFLRDSQRLDNQETRKALEAEKRKVQIDLETEARVRSDFLALLSHELRSPLNQIIGWTKLLSTRQFDEATTARTLERIDRDTKLLAQIIEDLLDASCITTGKLRLKICLVELVSVIKAAIDTVRPAADAKEIRIECRLDSSIKLFLGDSARLQQVVWNLLSNAVKFTHNGGRVEVGLKRISSYAQIKVSDTGVGIKPDLLPYVFDNISRAEYPFQGRPGGLGLGLRTVRHLVEQHGGTVHAESPGVGQGATFVVNLPLMSAGVEAGFHEQGSTDDHE